MALVSKRFLSVNVTNSGLPFSIIDSDGIGVFCVGTTPAHILATATLTVLDDLVLNGSISGGQMPTSSITGATTITAEQSGTYFTITTAGPYSITLPSASSGLNYKIFAGINLGVGEEVSVINAGMTGTVVNQTTVDSDTGSLQFTSTSDIGDSIEVYAIGSTWYYKAVSSGVGGIVTI